MAVNAPNNNNLIELGIEGAPTKNTILPNIKAQLGPLSLHIGGNGGGLDGVTERMGQGAQTTPQNRPDVAVHNAGDQLGGNLQPQGNQGNQGNQGLNNGNHYGWENGNNGNHNGWENGNGNNGGNGNRTTAKTTTAPPPVPTTQNPTTTAPGKQNPITTTNNTPTVNTPPIFDNQGNQTPRPTQNFPQWEPILIINTRLFDLNLRDNALRSAINETLRQNDIYVSRNVVNNVIGNTRSTNIPSEVRQLVQSVVNQLSNALNNSTPVNPQIIRQTAAEISNNLQSQINSARNILAFTPLPDAKNFSHLNIQERVFLAVELMFNHLPSETSLQNLSNKEIYNGLMLARGMVSSGENTANIRNLIALRSDILPNGFSPAGLRDLGQLVKSLVAGAANAKTTVNLDAAVQRFIKILIANNELGVLLAATALAKQAEFGSLSMNRTLALVQIYQLIARLMQAGEAAMKEAALKNAPAKNENNLTAIGLNKITDVEEKSAMLRDLQNNNLHNSLKNFLEFNPASITDRSASSFVNPDDARHAQQHFSSNHHDEIEQWVNSGNHRFVKEIDLDKPIGVVVERGSDDFFPATKARIVLVRDSSPQGWHFLKSFLVR